MLLLLTPHRHFFVPFGAFLVTKVQTLFVNEPQTEALRSFSTPQVEFFYLARAKLPTRRILDVASSHRFKPDSSGTFGICSAKMEKIRRNENKHFPTMTIRDEAVRLWAA